MTIAEDTAENYDQTKSDLRVVARSFQSQDVPPLRGPSVPFLVEFGHLLSYSTVADSDVDSSG